MQEIVSFIIPTKNEEGYIEDCLKSIKNLEGKKEIIVVDSYSKDRTVNIARKYGKVIFEKRKGPGVARNTGAKIAKGDILVFPDADVRFKKDFLKKIKEKFRKGVGGGVFNLVLYDNEKPTQNSMFSVWNSTVRFLIALGLGVTNGCCFAYMKDVFNKVGGFDSNLLTNEDHDLSRKVSRIKRFRFFNDIVVYTSMRRLYKYGIFSFTFLHFKTTLFYFLNHKSFPGYWEKPA